MYEIENPMENEMMDHRYQALSSREIEEMIQGGLDTVVFPIGAIEQHGPHAPVGTDAFIAQTISEGVARKLGALCLPPMWFGVSPHHMDFAGSITIRPELLTQIIEDVMISLIKHGIKNILILNGHGGNTAAIDTARTMVRYHHPGVFSVLSSVWVALQDIYETLPPEVKQENWRTMIAHGGLFESSAVMSIEEQMVKLEYAQPVSVAKYVQATDPALSVTVSMKDLSEIGSNGDPRGSSAELGRMFVDKSVEIIAEKYLRAKKVFRP